MNDALAHTFSLSCTDCHFPIDVPLQALSQLPLIVHCPHCQKQFGFSDSTIVSQIKQFIALCKEIKASEDLLSSASIAVRIGVEEVKVPFKLLLTRLRSTFDFDVGGKKITVSYRTEPRKIAEALEKELLSLK